MYGNGGPVSNGTNAPNKQQLLDALYPMPIPLASHEEAQRREHADLKCLSLAQLVMEQERVRFRLVFDDCPDQWLVDRLDAVEEAIRHAR